MPRRTREQIVFDKVLKHFKGKRNAMIHAINDQIKLRGREVISRQAIMAWRDNGVSPIHVIAVERATGGAVPREAIRPELYE